MHLLNCIFLVITIVTVVYANCFIEPYHDNGDTCNICDFQNLRNITERVIPNGCVELKYVNCHFGRFYKGLVNPADQVYQLVMINSVEYIEEKAFWDFKNASGILFRKNNLSLLPNFAFEGLSNLRVVDFSRNQIVKIDVYVFTGASSIRDLNLADNRIEWFYIKQLTNLQILNLENNLITVLSEIPQRLNEAHFGFNRITKIEKDDFGNMKFLKKLNLRWNNITEIESEAFYGTQHLEYVDLSCNNLTIVSNVMFRNKYHILPVRGGQEIVFSFKLNLQQNKITSFSSENTANDLISLDLSQNSIEQLDKSNFAQIDSLDLSNNKIKTVPFKGFHCEYRMYENPIHELKLSKNAITQLEVGSFLGLSSLEHLDLSHNRIETLNETIFLDTPKLLTLNVAHNPIRHLNAPEIVGFTSLQLIALCGNTFSDLTFVTEQFTKNNVRVVPGLDRDYKSKNEINCYNSPDLTFEVTTKGAIEISKENCCQRWHFNCLNCNNFHTMCCCNYFYINVCHLL